MIPVRKIKIQRKEKKQFFIIALLIVIFISQLFIISILTKKGKEYQNYQNQLLPYLEIIFLLYPYSHLLESLGEYEITFYTPSPEETDEEPSITASGKVAANFTVAVSPNLLNKIVKFGDIVYFEKLRRFGVVEDLTHERIKDRFDILVFDKSIAKGYGKIKSKVYKLKGVR